MEKIKVLLFAANPRGTAPLDLPREFREIDEEVRLSTFRRAVELILVPGTRPVDLLRKLNENQPQVVHFSSHGVRTRSSSNLARKMRPFSRARLRPVRCRPTNGTACSSYGIWRPASSDTLLMDTTPASSTAARRRNFRPHALEFTLAER